MAFFHAPADTELLHRLELAFLVGQDLSADEVGSDGEAQYGCCNFVYRDFIFGPVTAYRNKWEDWTSF